MVKFAIVVQNFEALFKYMEFCCFSHWAAYNFHSLFYWLEPVWKIGLKWW